MTTFEVLHCSKKHTVNVYTGTYGTLQYFNHDMFLYGQDGHLWLQVPLYFWKVVHNPEENEAVAFVGVNNPHESNWPISLCEVHHCLSLRQLLSK